MQTITVPLKERKYDIVIKKGMLAEIGSRLKELLPKARKLSVVTDTNVFGLYSKILTESLRKEKFEVDTVIIPAGEGSKCLTQLERLYNAFAAFGLTRSDAVIALGGGVVGDLTGFAAATMLRGVSYVQIPTTLLSQVDSSVGGKTAIDLISGKNLVGAFWQPKAVYMDPMCLNTLPNETFSDGMAEVIKYGCIYDASFFGFLDKCHDRKGIMDNIEAVLSACCNIKSSVVAEDETDLGRRMILNFGHTFGHAYELAGGYKMYTHGQAVAAGMHMAAKIGESIGLTPVNTALTIKSINASYGLPWRIDCSIDDYKHAIGLDKKSVGENINVVFLSVIGSAILYNTERNKLIELIAKETLP